MESEPEELPNESKSPPAKPDGLGLSINLDECYDEFTERAKVLPFVPKRARPPAK